MKKIVMVSVGLLIVGCGAFFFVAYPTKKSIQTAANPGALEFQKAYIKPAQKGGTTAAFGVFKNTTDNAITLRDVRMEGCMVAELHTHKEEVGILKMRAVDQLIIPAQGTYTLKSGGDHLMCMETSQNFKLGETYSLKLTTSQGHIFSYIVPVQAAKKNCNCHHSKKA